MSRPPQTEGGGSEEPTARFLRLADRQLRPAYRLAGYLLGSSDEAEDAVAGGDPKGMALLAEPSG